MIREQWHRGFETSAPRANQSDFIDDDWRHVHPDRAMHRRFQYYRAARPHHATCGAQPLGTAGCVDYPIVFRRREGAARALRTDALRLGNRKLLAMMAELMPPIETPQTQLGSRPASCSA